MRARTTIPIQEGRFRPRLVYSAGFELRRLSGADQDKLAAHNRSLRALRVSVGNATMGELCNLPDYVARVDFASDCIIAACDRAGGIVATAQIHRVSRFFAWAELWYTAWPGDWARGACGQAISRAIEWAGRSGFACLVAYASSGLAEERSMLERAGFHIAPQGNELIAELDLEEIT